MQIEPKIWVLKTSHTGDTNNRRAIAAAISPSNWQLVNFHQTENSVEKMLLKCAGADFLDEVREWSDIFIICEQETSAYSRELKKLSNGRVFVVGLQTPDIDCNDFEKNIGGWADYQTDLQILFSHHKTAHDFSEHSKSRRSVHDYVPTYVDQRTLSAAFNSMPPEIAKLKRNGPVFLLIVGSVIDSEAVFGHSNWESFPHEVKLMQDNFRCITKQVADAAKSMGGSVLVTTSRRTDDALASIVREELEGTPSYMYDWSKAGGAGNPYLQMLAAADRIVVSGDSISMTSDALAMGKPTFIYVPSGNPERTENRPLSKTLAETHMIKNEVRVYMERLASEKRIYPMRSLTAKNIKASQPLNSADEIAQSVLRHYRDFRRLDAKPANGYAVLNI